MPGFAARSRWFVPLLALVFPVAVRAQSGQEAAAPRPGNGGAPATAAPADSLDAAPRPRIPWFTRNERLVFGATAVGTTLATFADSRVRATLRAPSPEPHDARSVLFSGARTAGSPGVFVGSLALYATGRVIGRPALADAGLHATESIMWSGTVTHLLKGVVGRQRPYASEGHPARFEMGRGFTDGSHASFPSGHTSAAFAVAAVLTGEVTRRDAVHRWPSWLVGTVAYGSAAVIGISRGYHDAHWASDIVAGAGVGTLSGLVLTRRAHAPGHRRSRFTRWAIGGP